MEAKAMNFDALDGYGWMQLLREHPEYADKCDWKRIEWNEQINLLCKRPELIGWCDTKNFSGNHWAKLLAAQPQLHESCPWTKFDGYAWATLLVAQPQFADKCDWSKLNEHNWDVIVSAHPEFAVHKPSRLPKTIAIVEHGYLSCRTIMPPEHYGKESVAVGGKIYHLVGDNDFQEWDGGIVKCFVYAISADAEVDDDGKYPCVSIEFGTKDGKRGAPIEVEEAEAMYDAVHRALEEERVF